MKKLTAVDRIKVADMWHLPRITTRLKDAVSSLKQAEEDWCILNGSDGDRSSVAKAPILQVVDAEVAVNSAIELIESLSKMLKDGE